MHLGEGRTSKEIARMLDVSPRTVEAYRARLLKKCGAANVAELLVASELDAALVPRRAGRH